MSDIQDDIEANHDDAFDPLGLSQDETLDSLGDHKMRAGGERHIYTPETIHLLQYATRMGDYQSFKEFTKKVGDEDRPYALRGLLDFK